MLNQEEEKELQEALKQSAAIEEEKRRREVIEEEGAESEEINEAIPKKPYQKPITKKISKENVEPKKKKEVKYLNKDGEEVKIIEDEIRIRTTRAQGDAEDEEE